MKKNKENPWSDKAARKIAGAGIKIQSKFSDFMNKLFAGMNVKKLRTILIVFCLSCGGYSVYLIANAIFSKKQTPLKIDQVDVPKHFDRTGDETIIPETYVDEETYLKIQAFKKSSFYDSTIQARPGLLDSIAMLEEIYHSQKIK
jgi:hypothetical protein